jgi:HSP20 family protein
MSTKALTRNNEFLPSVFDDYFKPWSQWFNLSDLPDNRLSMPAANISDNKDNYEITLAAPGLKKSDFKLDVEGNVLTISSEKEESQEENKGRYTRREYSYSSFSRSFTLPAEVNQESIKATYDDGVLKVALPKKEEAKKLSMSRNIPVQ